MNQPKWPYLCLILFLIILPFFPATAEARMIRWAYIEFPPVFFTNAAGQPEGELIEIGSKVLVRAGYRWTTVSYPTKRMVAELVRGNINLWIGLASLPRFEGTTLVGESDIAQITLCAYTIGEKAPIRKKEDLSGKSVIILSGYSYGGWIHYIRDPASRVRAYEINDTHETAFKMLRAGRADYLLDYQGPSEKVLKALPVPGLSYNAISSFTARFVVSAKTPDARTVLNQLENAYKELVKEGQIVRK